MTTEDEYAEETLNRLLKEKKERQDVHEEDELINLAQHESVSSAPREVPNQEVRHAGPSQLISLTSTTSANEPDPTRDFPTVIYILPNADVIARREPFIAETLCASPHLAGRSLLVMRVWPNGKIDVLVCRTNLAELLKGAALAYLETLDVPQTIEDGSDSD